MDVIDWPAQTMLLFLLCL